MSKERLSNIIFNTFVALGVMYGLIVIWEHMNSQDEDRIIQKVFHLGYLQEQILSVDNNNSQSRKPLCKIWNCLNTYKCGKGGNDNLTVYIYPYFKYKFINTGKMHTNLSKEYYQIIRAITESKYFTPNPNEACLFLPSVNILDQRININLINSIFSSLIYWNNGANHLLFSLLPNKFDAYKNLKSGDAIILSSNFDVLSYRPGFDVSVPYFRVNEKSIDFTHSFKTKRPFTLLSSQLNISPHQLAIIKELTESSNERILLLTASRYGRSLERCEYKGNQCYSVPYIYGEAIFCLIARSISISSPDFLNILAFKCIPVIVADNLILPFEEIIDWSLASIRIRETDLQNLMNKLLKISKFKIFEMQHQISWLYTNYFKNTKTITLTALKILESRIFPHRSQNSFEWNIINSFLFNPLFLPLISPKTEGFTAVILTYDRIDSLFMLIQKLSSVSSLQSILVIWNNQQKSPPHLSAFPKILRPLRVIQMGSNKLSNRFYPYSEIETEAILTIDDDIVMLTNDEIEFGFEVWREFPDRIVGFPSRLHKWNNITMTWNYDSEWTNKISMVLTGAAFYHKFWGHVYTNAMPGNIKKWVDEHMNCEDIAMNFLVASITNKSPIKVTPRKKFKCPECTNTEMLSADLQHMKERSSCIDHFAHIFGHFPLRSVEFRADPVLFKDNFPEKLKRYNDIGNL